MTTKKIETRPRCAACGDSPCRPGTGLCEPCIRDDEEYRPIANNAQWEWAEDETASSDAEGRL